MDTAFSILQNIYTVYTTIKDAQDEFKATYKRMKDLLNQFKAMEQSETLVQAKLLSKYIGIANEFLAYLTKYKNRKTLSKVFHQSEMLAEIEGFNQKLEALFQLFHLAMGSHIMEHNKSQHESMDELVRGMRLLLQGAASGGKAIQSNDDMPAESAGASQRTGPIAEALAQGDATRIIGFYSEGTDNAQVEEAAQALCELATQEATRDAIVQAGGIPVLVEKLSGGEKATTSAVRVHTARTLRRLALRDIYEVAIVEAGAVPRLAAMLEASSDDLNVQGETNAASAALENLTFQPEHKLVMMRVPNLFSKLVKLVCVGSPSQKKHAMGALRELARNDECASAIEEAQGIPALVDVLNLGTTEQCALSLEALWNLASLQKNRTEIAAAHGINAIVAQIRNGASDDQRQLAASALAVLAQDDANDVTIGAAGGVELLVSLLRNGTDGQKNSAAWALSELANDKRNATTMVAAGVTPALMAAFRSGTDIQRAKAGAALVWIAQLTDDKTALVDEIGLSSVVNMLRGSADQKQNAAWIVAAVAEDPDLRRQLGPLDAIELLLDLVKNHVPKKIGVLALRHIVQENEANQSKMVHLGGIQVLLEVMSKLKDNTDDDSTEAIDYAIETLVTLVQKSDAVKLKFITVGGVEVAVDAMHNGPSASRKRRATNLLSIVTRVMDEDDEESVLDQEDGPRLLEICIKAFTSVLHMPCNDKSHEDELTRFALAGLARVALHPLAPTQESEQHDVLLRLLKVFNTTGSESNKRSVSQMLGEIVKKNEQMGTWLVDEGAILLLLPLLSEQTVDLQFAGVHGLQVLAGIEDLREQIGKTPGLCKSLVRLLKTAASDDIKWRAANTIYLLAKERDLAVKLAGLHGLEELVDLAKQGTQWTVRALQELSSVHGTTEDLVEIKAYEAALHLPANAPHVTQEAALRLLKNMSSHHKAGPAMLHDHVVPLCVKALQSNTESWKSLGVKILTNLKDIGRVEEPEEEDDHGYESAASCASHRSHSSSSSSSSSDSSSDSDDDKKKKKKKAKKAKKEKKKKEKKEKKKEKKEKKKDKKKDKKEKKKLKGKDKSESTRNLINDAEKRILLHEIREVGGIVPLLEYFEVMPAGKRVGILELLHDLVQADETNKRLIGGSMSTVAKIMQEGTKPEQVAAAKAVDILVGGSSRNATTAIHEGAVEAFILLLQTQRSQRRLRNSVRSLLANFRALQTAETLEAAEKLRESLAAMEEVVNKDIEE